MIRFLFFFLLFPPLFAQAQGYSPAALKGVKTFSIQVAKLPDQAIQAGITSIELLKIVEKAVRDDRLSVVAKDKADAMIVLTLEMDDLMEIGYMYSVEMSVLREAKVKQFRRDVKATVSVWHRSKRGIITRMGTRQDVRREVANLIQQLLDDHLDAQK